MKIKRLFIDIETSPCIGYFWRPGYSLNIPYQNIITESAIICICYKWEDSEHVHSMTWDSGDDKEMLRKFIDIAVTADEVVAHNSDRFDLPWVRTRCLFHRIKCPNNFVTFDTLKAIKGQMRLNSNRLDYVANYLGVGGKMETGGFDLWKGVMNGDRKSLRTMVEYCKQDVALLERVFKEIYVYSKPKTHAGVHAGGYKHHCPSCGSPNTKRNKKKTTALGTPKIQMYCNECCSYFTLTENVYRKSVETEAAVLKLGQKK